MLGEGGIIRGDEVGFGGDGFPHGSPRIRGLKVPKNNSGLCGKGGAVVLGRERETGEYQEDDLESKHESHES